MPKRIRVAYRDDEVEEWPIEACARQKRLAARPRLQTARFCFRGLRASSFWTPSAAGMEIRELCKSLEARFDDILREVTRTLSPLIDGDDDDDDDSSDDAPAALWAAQTESLHHGVWLRCELHHARNRAALPVLASVLDGSAAVMRDPPGRRYLSYMLAGAGGTSVAPHAGPTNHRLRLHLPLLLPTPQHASGGSGCADAAPAHYGISVGGEWRAWERGRCLVLDDSFEHWVDLRSDPHAGGQRVRRGVRGRSSTTAAPTTTTTRTRRAQPGAGGGEQRVVSASSVSAVEAPAQGATAWATAPGATERQHRVILVCDVWHPDAGELCPHERRRRTDA